MLKQIRRRTSPKDYRKVMAELQTMKNALNKFLLAYPEYRNTSQLDELRKTEYNRLDSLEQIYLDYTGGSLYAESQLESHLQFLSSHVFGNPHSNNPTSRQMTDAVERARNTVLKYFNASPDEYTAIFTQNASGALKLVGEAYPFQQDSKFILTFDNHNSVNGIREFAKNRGSQIEYVPVTMPDLRIDEDFLTQSLGKCGFHTHNLIAYPAQSNFTGVQHSLEWIEKAHSAGCDVLLDAAAYVPTNQLDLSRWNPDFVALSFYKMFGYPTGIGCLIARKSSLKKLQRPWFAGGTIALASVRAMDYRLADNEAGFEDGTVNYLNIPAVETGLNYLRDIGVETIHQRVWYLTGWVLDELMALQHSNGKPLVRVYGPVDTTERGGTVAFNLYDPQGTLIDFRRVEELANQRNISLRTGCFCNPGINEIAEGLTEAEMSAGFTDDTRMDYPYFLSILEHQDGKSAGAIRVSMGIASNFEDVYQFIDFVKMFIDQSSQKIGRVSFDIQTCRRLRDGS